VVQNSDIVFIAVKPQYVSVVLLEAKEHLRDRHIIVSIAAGIRLEDMKVLQGTWCLACHKRYILASSMQ
jgi:pyrroline-5-carboxylate reductase